MDGSCSNEKKIEEHKKDAWRRLYEENRERILALAFRFTRNLQDAEDILQETFIKAFRSSTFPPSETGANLSSWIYRIALNTSIDFCRKKKRRSETGLGRNQAQGASKETEQLPKVSLNPEERLMQSELSKLLDDYINRLPWRQRSIFILKYYEQLKIKEIAKLLGCSEGSVKRSLFRSVQNLRKGLHFLMTE